MAAFFTAPSIAWGPGAVEQLSALGARRALVVVDDAVGHGDGPRRVTEELEKAGTHVEVTSAGATPGSTASVARLRDAITSAGPDWLVALGGGSTIDGAKAARWAAEVPGVSLEAPPSIVELPGPPRVRFVAIPTTSGSGSEASWAADLTGPEGAPIELAHRALVPEWALVDPAFARGRSRPQVLAGALEIAGLAAEAYLSAWANPFSDALAVSALGTVLARLPHAVRWSDDPEAPESLHYAATAAGLAASNAQRGLAHALARALEAPTGLPYATLVGVALPAVLEFDRPACRERLDTLADAVARPGEPARPSIAERLRRLSESLGLPSTLVAAGVDRRRVDAARRSVVERTLRSPAALANPRVPGAADLETLLEVVLVGPGETRPVAPR